jgi:hypothetical protein
MPLTPGTKAYEAKENSLRRRYKTLDGDAASSSPCIVVDMQGIILTWYLPGILTDSRQVGLFALPITAKNLTPQECNVGGARKAGHIADSTAKQQLLAQ